MLLLKMGPEVPSRARRALPALRRSEKEGGRRPPEPSRIVNKAKQASVHSLVHRALSVPETKT